MNVRQKIEALEAHYKINAGTTSWKERPTAVKKAAKMENESIEVIYDRVLGSKKDDKAVAVLDVKATEVKDTAPAKKDTTPAKPAEVRVEGSTHKVEVAAPVLNITLPAAPAINVASGGGTVSSWVYTLEATVAYLFVFASGSMAGAGALFGWLAYKGVLRITGGS